MIKFESVRINPVMARRFLDANPSNRRVKKPVVLKYANDLANGKWKPNTGETIKISNSVIILDGQHRLLAIIQSNVTAQFHVVTGLEESVFDVIDTGSSRNATDTFKIKGIKHDHLLPSIISTYNLLKEGKRLNAQVNEKSTNAMLLEQYFKDEIFWQHIAKEAHKGYLSFAKIIPPSYIGAFYAVFIKIDESKGYDFISQLTTGVGIDNDVITMLRNKLIQDKVSAKKMPPSLKIALIIKAWNCFIGKRIVKVLKFDTAREEYPIILS